MRERTSRERPSRSPGPQTPSRDSGVPPRTNKGPPTDTGLAHRPQRGARKSADRRQGRPEPGPATDQAQRRREQITPIHPSRSEDLEI